MTGRPIVVVRLLLGAVLFVNGFNWFFKIITPYPSMSDFVHYLPPPDIVGALIDNGILFHLAKAIELLAGIALLANCFVPLALVVSMSVTVTVFIVDVFKPDFRLRAFMMGTGTMAMSVTLLIAYFDHFRPMLALKGKPSADPAVADSAITGGAAADIFGRTIKPLFMPLVVISLAVGTVQVGWLAVMIGQYVADPKAIYQVRPMVPRR